MLDPEVRRTILARVEAALDRLETAEGPPEGIAAVLLEEDVDASAPDLYALLARVTALTREVQLQGRAANRLSSEVTQLVQQVSASSEGQISPGRRRRGVTRRRSSSARSSTSTSVSHAVVRSRSSRSCCG